MKVHLFEDHQYHFYEIEILFETLNKGGVAVYPTDTSHGIGTLLTNKKGIERILKVKDEERTKRLTLLCENIAQASRYALINDYSFKVMRYLVPGPYTFILPAMPLIPRVMLSRQRTIGIRIPGESYIQDVLPHLHYPIVNSSISVSPQEHQLQSLEPLVDTVIYQTDLQEEFSTVISLLDGSIKILREGKGYDKVIALLEE